MNRVLRFVVALALLTVASSGVGKAAAGDVVLMPNRDALTGTAVVVWGNTAAGHAGQPYTINFGDASANAVGTVTDPSYVAVTHTYASPGIYTVTMTVAGDSDTATVRAHALGSLSLENQRNVRINMAIEDGLRHLYFSQDNRAANYTSQFTSWTASSGYGEPYYLSYSSLVVLALENHGHTVLDDATQDIFQPVVRRGLNFILDNLIQIPLGPQNGNDPCVGVPADANKCVGLGHGGFESMYVSAVNALAVAGSGAPGAVVPAGIGASNGNFVAGRTFADIIQRQANAITWGMNDSGDIRGGFGYGLNDGNYGDGSTAGWGVLALLDAEAAGAVMPAWVRADVLNYSNSGLNSDGSLKYQLYNSDNQSNFPKVGVALEVMKFVNKPAGDAKVLGAQGLLSTHWAAGYSTDGFDGPNKGHAYGMFNAFKGLKLYNVQTLPGVGRAAGPGSIPANDWHADYQDFLLANQVAANDPTGGNFAFPNGFSYQGASSDMGAGTPGYTAIAELILSPTALVVPASLTLSPLTATNQLPGQNTHTVTAVGTSTSGSFIPGATVTFTVTAGPNIGQTGNDVTDANGEATFTYTSNGAAGSDTIQATIGDLISNTVNKTWLAAETLVCDVDNDKDVDMVDINAINAARNTIAAPGDKRDANNDGVINVVDSRFCALRRTN
jgi:PKD repeat protein